MSCQLPTQLWKDLPTNRHLSSRCCQRSNEQSQNRDWKRRLRLSHSQHMLQLLSAYLRESQFIRLEGMDYLWHLATECQAFHPAVPDVIAWSLGVGGGLAKSFDTLSILIWNDYWWVLMCSGQFLTLLCRCCNIVSLTAGYSLCWIPVTTFLVQMWRVSKQSKQDFFSKGLRKSS